jgi:ATP-binding cassette subfamily B protein
MRKKISNKINVIPLNYFDTHQYGDTLSRITNDVDTIAQSLSQSLASIFSSTISIVGIPIAMFISC